MGCSLDHKEPTNNLLLQAYKSIWEFFQAGGWIGYVEQLQAYDNDVGLEFILNLQND